MVKIIPVSKRDIDARPTISISHKTYLRALEKLRAQAKAEKRRLITNEGIEDYRQLPKKVKYSSRAFASDKETIKILKKWAKHWGPPEWEQAARLAEIKNISFSVAVAYYLGYEQGTKLDKGKSHE